MKRFIPLLVLTPLISHSAPLSVDQVTACFGSGKTTRVDAGPVMDQDGLGTCYANTASALIQKAMGRDRPVSYQQIALSNADYQAERRAKYQLRYNLIDDRREQFAVASEGGFTCAAVESVKNRGFCSAENFSLEAHGGNDPLNRQAKIITSFGKVVDQLNSFSEHMTEAKWQNLTNHLTVLLSERKKNCERPLDERTADAIATNFSAKFLNSKGNFEWNIATSDAMLVGRLSPSERAERLKLKTDSETAKAAYEKIQAKFMVSSSDPRNPDVNNWRLTPEALAIISNELTNYRKQIKALENLTVDEREDELAKLQSPMAKLLQSAGADFQTSVMQEIAKDPEYNEALFSGIRSAESCDEVMDENTIEKMKPYLSGDQPCPAPVNDDPALAEFKAEAERIIRAVRRGDIGSMGSRANGLIGVLAPRCAEEMAQTKAQASQMQCENFLLDPEADASTVENFGNTVKFSPNLQGQEMTKRGQQWAAYRLCESRPVEVSICFDLFRKTGPLNTNFCKNAERDREGNFVHGFHSVLVVGHSVAEDGKMKFLVQNSWGQSCPFMEEDYATGKGAECEMENGVPTGRFWISGDTLFNNAKDLSSIKTTGN